MTSIQKLGKCHAIQNGLYVLQQGLTLVDPLVGMVPISYKWVCKYKLKNMGRW